MKVKDYQPWFCIQAVGEFDNKQQQSLLTVCKDPVFNEQGSPLLQFNYTKIRYVVVAA